MSGFWAAALVLTLVSAPYVIIPVVAALRSADPAMEEVARSLGRSPRRGLRRGHPAAGLARGRGGQPARRPVRALRLRRRGPLPRRRLHPRDLRVVPGQLRPHERRRARPRPRRAGRPPGDDRAAGPRALAQVPDLERQPPGRRPTCALPGRWHALGVASSSATSGWRSSCRCVSLLIRLSEGSRRPLDVVELINATVTLGGRLAHGRRPRRAPRPPRRGPGRSLPRQADRPGRDRRLLRACAPRRRRRPVARLPDALRAAGRSTRRWARWPSRTRCCSCPSPSAPRARPWQPCPLCSSRRAHPRPVPVRRVAVDDARRRLARRRGRRAARPAHRDEGAAGDPHAPADRARHARDRAVEPYGGRRLRRRRSVRARADRAGRRARVADVAGDDASTRSPVRWTTPRRRWIRSRHDRGPRRGGDRALRRRTGAHRPVARRRLGRGRRRARCERLGQDHPAPRARRASCGPSAGEVRFGDRVVSGPSEWVPPERRRVGIVPQEGALFPHLDVAGNVAFGLPRSSDERVEEMLALVGMSGMGARRVQELSGGQQQRVALARALAPEPGRAAARRAVLGARRLDAGAPAGRGPRGARGDRHDHRARHPRPGGGAVLRRPGRGRARRPGRAGGTAPTTSTSARSTSTTARFVGEVVELDAHVAADGIATCALGEVHVPGAPAAGHARASSSCARSSWPSSTSGGWGTPSRTGPPAPSAPARTTATTACCWSSWPTATRSPCGCPAAAGRAPGDRVRVVVGGTGLLFTRP